MRALLLVPGTIEADSGAQTDDRPRHDVLALRDELGADIADYRSVDEDRRPALLRVSRKLGRNAALAAVGYIRRRQYDIIYANGENIAIPLALLLKNHARRPFLVTIGHRLSTPKKRLALRMSHSEMDVIFVYSSAQQRFAVGALGIPAERVRRIPFHADHRYFRVSSSDEQPSANVVCSAGLEWRDYSTLIDSVRGLDIELKIAAASPWSRSRNELADIELPPNVTARAYGYTDLRQLYARSRLVAVPLYPTDFQAGITTILEGMSMSRPVIASHTSGQTDTIVHGKNGLYVPPLDASALRDAICRVLQSPDEAESLGRSARRDVESMFTLDQWVGRIAGEMRALPIGANRQ